MTTSSAERRSRRGLHALALCLLVLWMPIADARAAPTTPSDPCCNLTVEGTLGERDADSVTVEFVVTLSRGKSPGTTIEATPSWDAAPQTKRVPILTEDAASTTIAFTFAAPPTGETGTIRGVVEPASENDDVADNSDSIRIDAAAADFAVQRTDPASNATATRVVVRFAVVNRGTLPATPSVQVEAPWGARQEPPSIDPIEPGDRISVEVEFSSVPADWRGRTAEFVASVEPAANETKVDDNSTTIRVAIREPGSTSPGPAERHPDLRVRVLGIPSQVDPARITVRVRVRNIGDAAAPATELSAGAPFDQQQAKPVGSLAAGEHDDLTLRLRVPAQAQGTDATLVVTARRVAEELVTANNSARRAITLLAPAGRDPQTGEAEEDEASPGSSGPTALLLVGLIIAALLVLALAWHLYRHHPRDPGAASVTGPRPVRTGFATRDAPGGELAPDAVLAPDEKYFFWVEIGDGPPTTAPAAAVAPLEVALFAIGGGATAPAGADRGMLAIGERGGAQVVRQPAGAPPPGADDALAARRLLFDVITGGADAVLRCSIYAHNVLVWSQLVRVPVAQPGARSADVDFAIMPSLEPRRLGRLAPHRLSVLLNSDGAGTHALTLLGEGGFKADASFDVAELQSALDSLRGGLRLAAWGSEDEWSPGQAYRYTTPDPERSRLDLTRMAIRGHRFHTQVITRFAGERNPYQLLNLTRRSGLVQIATKESPRNQLPGALLYDHPLDTTKRRLEDYGLCDAFRAACDGDEPLAASPCLRGECPSYGNLDVMCPSGFWGYRHALGMPVSTGGTADIETDIFYSPVPEMLVAVATDPDLALRESHEAALRLLPHGVRWQRAATRAETIEGLRRAGSHVVYFYCHGGAANNVPFLHVGDPSEQPLTSDFLFANRIRWDQPRPLVFLNGCRTTAVEPRAALEFVSFWLGGANAAGVVGSDITVFEPLASTFAEHCLAGFLGGEPLGACIRNARLALLRQHNPLALAYVPFALAGLQLSAAAAGRDVMT